MSAEVDVEAAGRNPQTFEEASRLVKYVESLFMPWDFDALRAGFTDDCVVRYAEFPEMHGKEELDKFFGGRASRQKDNWLKKDLRLFTGNMSPTLGTADGSISRRARTCGVGAWRCGPCATARSRSGKALSISTKKANATPASFDRDLLYHIDMRANDTFELEALPIPTQRILL